MFIPETAVKNQSKIFPSWYIQIVNIYTNEEPCKYGDVTRFPYYYYYWANNTQ